MVVNSIRAQLEAWEKCYNLHPLHSAHKAFTPNEVP